MPPRQVPASETAGENSSFLTALQYTWVTQVTYIPAIILTKVAIVCFFMQVFPGPKFRMLCYGTIFWCFLFMISTTIAAILACVPVEKLWTNWMGNKEGVCYDNNAFWWTHSVGHWSLQLVFDGRQVDFW